MCNISYLTEIEVGYLCKKCRSSIIESYNAWVHNIKDSIDAGDFTKTCASCDPYMPMDITHMKFKPAERVMGYK